MRRITLAFHTLRPRLSKALAYKMCVNESDVHNTNLGSLTSTIVLYDETDPNQTTKNFRAHGLGYFAVLGRFDAPRIPRAPHILATIERKVLMPRSCTPESASPASTEPGEKSVDKTLSSAMTATTSSPRRMRVQTLQTDPSSSSRLPGMTDEEYRYHEFPCEGVEKGQGECAREKEYSSSSVISAPIDIRSGAEYLYNATAELTLFPLGLGTSGEREVPSVSLLTPLFESSKG
ncbi:hypothetical protein NMY22_g18006 [Coprinellus aureogranulatus]|nr:hypothetical protein NMY22_g18006 [Coprinellus aureogranulatus]